MRFHMCLKRAFGRAGLCLVAGLLLVAGPLPHSAAGRDGPGLAAQEYTAVEVRGTATAPQPQGPGSDPPPIVTDITPDSGANNGAVLITDLSGSYFQDGATVKLTKTSQPDVPGSGVSVVSSSTITCTFDLTGVVTGTWDVVVTNPDTSSDTLTEGFTVRSPSHVYLPSVIRYWPLVLDADTTVVQAYPTVNAGAAVDMWVGFDHCPDTLARIARSLVRFDVSEIPDAANILQVRLYLRLTNSCDIGERTHKVTVYRATGPWEEMSVTWNTQPGYAEPYGSAWIPSRTWGWYSFDVTGLVRAWVNHSLHNYGMVVRGPESSGSDSARLGFHTRESPFDPYLEVTYAGSSAAAPVVRVYAAAPNPAAASSPFSIKELGFLKNGAAAGASRSGEWTEGTSD